jgi:hypothetical protein
LIALSVRANVARSGDARRLDGGDDFTEQISMARQIQIELLPHERAALLKGNFTIDEVRAQLKALASSEDVETITMTSVDVNWLASDLTHTIVKRGCRDQDIIDLSERLDYIDDSGDGSLDGWY